MRSICREGADVYDGLIYLECLDAAFCKYGTFLPLINQHMELLSKLHSKTREKQQKNLMNAA